MPSWLGLGESSQGGQEWRKDPGIGGRAQSPGMGTGGWRRVPAPAQPRLGLRPPGRSRGASPAPWLSPGRADGLVIPARDEAPGEPGGGRSTRKSPRASSTAELGPRLSHSPVSDAWWPVGVTVQSYSPPGFQLGQASLSSGSKGQNGAEAGAHPRGREHTWGGRGNPGEGPVCAHSLCPCRVPSALGPHIRSQRGRSRCSAEVPPALLF